MSVCSHADYKALTNATLLVTQIRVRWTQGEWLEAEIGEEVCGSNAWTWHGVEPFVARSSTISSSMLCPWDEVRLILNFAGKCPINRSQVYRTSSFTACGVCLTFRHLHLASCRWPVGSEVLPEPFHSFILLLFHTVSMLCRSSWGWWPSRADEISGSL